MKEKLLGGRRFSLASGLGAYTVHLNVIMNYPLKHHITGNFGGRE
jgi:hypothetical protein